MRLGMVKMEEIEIGERYRKEYGDTGPLTDSIKKTGLIQPLAVMAQEGDKPYLLLAGGRRCVAIKRVGTEVVPVRIYDRKLTKLEIRTIELAENFYRKDLEWLEQVNLMREIHQLQQEVHGERLSTAPEAPGWSTKDTAELTGRSRSSIKQDVQLAEAADRFPEAFESCRTKHDASKILTRLGEEIVKGEIAKRVAAETIDVGKRGLIERFILRDFFEGVKDVPDSSISLVEIDPPYSIDLPKQKKGWAYGDSYNEVSKEDYISFLRKTFEECYRVMSDHSWLICWFGPEPWGEPIYKELIGAGFDTTRLACRWTKPSGQCMQPTKRLANTYESFYYANKGSPAIIKQGRSNVFDFPPVPANQKVHPTERPIDMMEEILSTFVWKGARVMVPFLGSGNTMLAAHNLEMTSFGFELSKSYKDSFLVRIHKM